MWKTPNGGRAEMPNNTAGELMGVVRECFYVPDGKAPENYDDARDFKMLLYWLSKGVDPTDIEDAIRGLAKMRDDGVMKWVERGEKLTLRVLNPKEARYGRHIAKSARDYWREYQRRTRKKPLGMERFRITFDGGSAA